MTFSGHFVSSGSVTTESPKEAGITIPVPVLIIFVGTVNNELSCYEFDALKW